MTKVHFYDFIINIILMKKVRLLVVEDLLENLMSDSLILPEIHHLYRLNYEFLDLLHQVQLIVNTIYILFAFPIHFDDVEVEFVLKTLNFNLHFPLKSQTHI
jgi:hypothetical protein